MPDFEVFTRKAVRATDEPAVTLQKGGAFVLNSAAYEALGTPEAVELLFARAERIIGFRAVSKDVPHAYSVRKQKNTRSVMVAGKAFTQHWSIGVDRSMRYPATMQGDVLSVNLQSEPIPARMTRQEKMMAGQ